MEVRDINRFYNIYDNFLRTSAQLASNFSIS